MEYAASKAGEAGPWLVPWGGATKPDSSLLDIVMLYPVPQKFERHPNKLVYRFLAKN